MQARLAGAGDIAGVGVHHQHADADLIQHSGDAAGPVVGAHEEYALRIGFRKPQPARKRRNREAIDGYRAHDHQKYNGHDKLRFLWIYLRDTEREKGRHGRRHNASGGQPGQKHLLLDVQPRAKHRGEHREGTHEHHEDEQENDASQPIYRCISARFSCAASIIKSAAISKTRKSSLNSTMRRTATRR